jgi:uncharacterized protein (TIGR03545 family)
MKFKVFRWKAIGPLLLLFTLLGLVVWIFAEPVARETTEEASTELLGTQVDLGQLDLLPRQASVELQALQIADPFMLTRNLLEADAILLKLNPAALAEKKIVIENLSLSGMRFGTSRKTPARAPSGKGFTPQVYRAVQQWTDQFKVPLLSLTPVDTIRQLVLNPDQLTTVKQAQRVLARTDSTRKALEQTFQQLDIRPTVDSARALVQRLSATDPKALGIEGTRQAVQSVRQTLRDITAARRRVDSLERNAKAAVTFLGQGVDLVNQATQQDVAFAKSLLKLPTFSAPEIGTALFGKVSIDRFKQALYWAELAQKYMPPGLLPRPRPGPQRLRAAGSTIDFPKAAEFPQFLLQQGSIDFAIGGTSPVRGAYTATVQGLTSAPALYGRPAVISVGRRAKGSVVAAVDIGAVINHVTSHTHDSVNARLRGIKLPSFDLPGLPFRLTPGIGSAELVFSMRGSALSGRWSVRANKVSWTADTAGRKANDIERLVWRVIGGLNDLSVVAQLGGTFSSPQLSIASNLDQAIAQRLKAVVGEEVARAERMVRAKVDSLVAEKVQPVKRQVAEVQTKAIQRIAGERQRLDQVEAELNAQLKRLTGGLAPGLELPKIKL